MQAVTCPPFEYATHQRAAEVQGRCAAILVDLRSGQYKTNSVLVDTRPVHGRMFDGLTPPQCEYYAGNYRGSEFFCLRDYNVKVGGDPRVGTVAYLVALDMAAINEGTQSSLAALDAAHALPLAQLSAGDRLLYLVKFVCVLLVEFMRVHPYADGNGHMGRFLVWAALGRYGYWPKKWPLNNRPPDPPYSQLLSLYRDGQKEPLETFVLNCIKG